MLDSTDVEMSATICDSIKNCIEVFYIMLTSIFGSRKGQRQEWHRTAKIVCMGKNCLQNEAKVWMRYVGEAQVLQITFEFKFLESTVYQDWQLMLRYAGLSLWRQNALEEKDSKVELMRMVRIIKNKPKSSYVDMEAFALFARCAAKIFVCSPKARPTFVCTRSLENYSNGYGRILNSYQFQCYSFAHRTRT